MFPLLLRLQEGPLIVDQPEDNLDNRHIAQSIAPALLKDKRTRQIAFTSHNANLVVLADCELIAMFEGSGSTGKIEEQGFLCTSVSNITQRVIDILDGGDTALEVKVPKIWGGELGWKMELVKLIRAQNCFWHERRVSLTLSKSRPREE